MFSLILVPLLSFHEKTTVAHTSLISAQNLRVNWPAISRLLVKAGQLPAKDLPNYCIALDKESRETEY